MTTYAGRRLPAESVLPGDLIPGLGNLEIEFSEPQSEYWWSLIGKVTIQGEEWDAITLLVPNAIRLSVLRPI